MYIEKSEKTKEKSEKGLNRPNKEKNQKTKNKKQKRRIERKWGYRSVQYGTIKDLSPQQLYISIRGPMQRANRSTARHI